MTIESKVMTRELLDKSEIGEAFGNQFRDDGRSHSRFNYEADTYTRIGTEPGPANAFIRKTVGILGLRSWNFGHHQSFDPDSGYVNVYLRPERLTDPSKFPWTLKKPAPHKWINKSESVTALELGDKTPQAKIAEVWQAIFKDMGVDSVLGQIMIEADQVIVSGPQYTAVFGFIPGRTVHGLVTITRTQKLG